MFRDEILKLFKNKIYITSPKVAKTLKIDKSLASGYIQAMVDYDDLQVSKEGNSKLYFLKKGGAKKSRYLKRHRHS